MQKKSQVILLLALLSYSCVSGQKENHGNTIVRENYEETGEESYWSQLEEDLIGEWITSSMRVWVKTFNHSDTSFIVDVPEEAWEMKMSIKPIRTAIYKNGTYTSEFRNSFDSLMYITKGTWLVDGDTLIMQDHQAVYRYQVFIDGNRAEFHSMIDWDGDGLADDEYFGIQYRVRQHSTNDYSDDN